ncbi:ester cyclase [Longispora sp. K20-0274]|uniref:ester cyclase n=1 Tax=Longispora sp. K20-0274 TaxID=3088255 RepID=UPI00399A4D63
MSDADVHRRVPEEIINKRQVDLIDDVFAPDFVEHVLIPGYTPDRAGLHRFFDDYLAAFPDMHCAIQNEVNEGDKHVIHITATGTMRGDLMGMPAANKQASWEEIHISRMRDGKIVEHWGVIDQLGMMQQLGFVPPGP